jgi:hypothetical protein
MNLNLIPRVVWGLPIVLLIVALWRLPYGYYTFVRIVTCGIATLIAIVAFSEPGPPRLWIGVFLAIAILFNPFIPIHLNRAVWFYLDLGAATAFLAHLVLVRQKLT